ncbi:MAG: hypothetical protein M0020_09165 [Actinomycetota bacterium]|nr:hypothetical protein [Actinomycetota bacterium]
MATGTPVAQTAQNPQPQTTVEGPGPFIRNSQAGMGPIYLVSGTPMGGMINQALVAKPGYYRNFRVEVDFVTSGTITGSTALAADAPYNYANFIQMKDSFGTPVITGSGYTVTKLIQLYGGSFGVNNGTNDVANLPSYSALSYTTGAGSFSYQLPLEFVKGIGCTGGANAALPPTLQFNLASGGQVFTGGTALFPTITTTVDASFYWLPETTAPNGTSLEPPGIGTTRQWAEGPVNPVVGTGSSTPIQLARVGGFIDTFIFVARDSTGARNDNVWPNRLQFIVDGIPVIDATMKEWFDNQWIEFGAVARPAGVLAFTRKNSLSQQSLGLLDSGETTMSTNPGTQLQLYGSPWGTFSNGPATFTAVLGQIVPAGSIIQGLPEL